MKQVKTFIEHILQAAIAITISTQAFAVENLHVEAANSSIEFLAKGSPGFLKIQGTEGKLKGTLALNDSKLNGELVADLNLFKTGIDLRDQHMKEKYLETGKFPQATLKIDNQAINLASTEKQSLQGLLTLHGVTKPVALEAIVKKTDAKKYDVQSSFKIVLSDFGIDVPKYLGITVAEDVTVATKMQAEAK